ncbi:hypothetical protein [Hymenobacter sp. APR13]|uniref:hypothetical protein n=1 Tax=Hymenobacter sp. APR13 TaxID=1356852 RepID=UPI0004E05D54|nr:hypothetical protein [Hymenobacter sp. APR13]AII53657.1 hypothetical protein N008_16960 [Hymenobacter sp. APR13]
MTADELASHLSTLGQQLAEASDTGDAGRGSVLEQARVFLFNYLPQEPHVPYRADELLELLAPSPHTHRSWEEERLLLLEGLTLLHQLWQPARQPPAESPAAAPEPAPAPKRRVRRRIGPAPE